MKLIVQNLKARLRELKNFFSKFFRARMVFAREREREREREPCGNWIISSSAND